MKLESFHEGDDVLCGREQIVILGRSRDRGPINRADLHHRRKVHGVSLYPVRIRKKGVRGSSEGH